VFGIEAGLDFKPVGADGLDEAREHCDVRVGRDVDGVRGQRWRAFDPSLGIEAADQKGLSGFRRSRRSELPREWRAALLQ
jgi:hypothetical protein